jgi:hypothetical protein
MKRQILEIADKLSNDAITPQQAQTLLLCLFVVSGSLQLTDEESQYRLDLINELINIYEHPEDSNKEWKDAIIGVAREKGYGNDR